MLRTSIVILLLGFGLEDAAQAGGEIVGQVRDRAGVLKQTIERGPVRGQLMIRDRRSGKWIATIDTRGRVRDRTGKRRQWRITK